MRELFLNFLNAGLSGSVIIAVVLLLRLVLKKAPRAAVCLLWGLVMVRLLCPFSIPSPFSLQPDLEYTVPEVPYSEIISQEEISGSVDLPSTALDPGVSPTPQVHPDGTSQPPTLPEAEPAPSSPGSAAVNWLPVFATIWLSGVGIMILYCTASYLRLKWKVRGTIPMEGYDEIHSMDTAFVLGFFPPRIYLPAGLSPDCRLHVLEHERAHIARQDHWFKFLGFIALSLHWYNPLVWVSFWLLCRDIEMACDQRVVAGKSLEYRKSYSAALLQCSAGHHAVHTCPVAFAETGVKQRIVSVLNYRKPGFWMIALSVLAIVLVAVFFMTDPVQVDAPEPSPDPGTHAPADVDIRGWGLTVTAANATPTGCTLVFTQRGGLTYQDDTGATVNGELTMGSNYWIQAYDGAAWSSISPIAKPLWDAAAYIVPLDGELAMKIDWEALYGILPVGRYRIGKTISGPGSGGDYTTHNYFAEFEINGGTYAEAALLESCRLALEEFQSRGSWYLMANDSFVHDSSATEEEWWINDGDWIQSSTPADAVMYTHTMCRDGNFYQRLGGGGYIPPDVEPDVWYATGVLYGANLPWLLTLAWDSTQITLESHQSAMGSQEVVLHMEGPLKLFHHWSADSAELTLTLGSDGKLESAAITASVAGENGSGALFYGSVTDLGSDPDTIAHYIESQTIQE